MIATAKDGSLESVIDLETKADKLSTRVSNFISNNYAKINAANAAASLERALAATNTELMDKLGPTIAIISCGAIANGLELYQSGLLDRVANSADVFNGIYGAIIGGFIWPLYEVYVEKDED